MIKFIKQKLHEAWDSKDEGIHPKIMVKEVGEGNAKSYEWGKVSSGAYRAKYEFNTPSEILYDVTFLERLDWNMGEYVYELNFKAGGSDIVVTNKGEMFGVMSTVVGIIKEFVSSHKTNKIVYISSKRDTDDNSRDKLYMAYINKLIPSAVISRVEDAVVIDLTIR